MSVIKNQLTFQRITPGPSHCTPIWSMTGITPTVACFGLNLETDGLPGCLEAVGEWLSSSSHQMWHPEWSELSSDCCLCLLPKHHHWPGGSPTDKRKGSKGLSNNLNQINPQIKNTECIKYTELDKMVHSFKLNNGLKHFCKQPIWFWEYKQTIWFWHNVTQTRAKLDCFLLRLLLRLFSL